MDKFLEQHVDLARREKYYRNAAMAQMEILNWLKDSGLSVEVSPFRHCYEFISQSLELMFACTKDEEEAEADAHSEVDNKAVNKNELLGKIEKWKDEKDGRCAVAIIGERDKDGKMQIATTIVGNEHDTIEAINKEYDCHDDVFSNLLKMAGII